MKTQISNRLYKNTYKEKMISPTENFEELCIGFIQYAYNEMQSEEWTNRRNENYARYNIAQEDFLRFKINTLNCKTH